MPMHDEIYFSIVNQLKQRLPEVNIKNTRYYQGDDHYIIEVNTTLIFKCAKSDDYGCHMRCEVKLLRYLYKKISCTIPQVLYYFPEINCFGYKKISGVSFTKFLYNSLTVNQQEKLVEDLAQFIYELHTAVSVDQAEDLDLKPARWPLTTEEMVIALRDNLDTRLNHIFIKFIDEYNVMREVRLRERVLIHNDLHEDNILFNKKIGSLKGIIDFTDAAFDDPYLEFRNLYLINSSFMQEVAQLYGKKRNYLINLYQIHLYYLATEFSRLVESKKMKNSLKSNAISERILKNAFADFSK